MSGGRGWGRVFRLPQTRRRIDADIDAELRFHLEGRVEELVARGMPRAEAEREARRRFGDAGRVGAECRVIDEGHLRTRARAELFGSMVQDARYAARGLARRPVFTATVLLTLALGVGANTAIFTVVDAVWLGWMGAFPEPERLVLLQKTAGPDRFPASPADFRDWRDQARGFERVGGYFYQTMSLTGDGAPERVLGAAISHEVFRALGVAPARGRGFLPEEEQEGRHRVVLLGDALWRQRFGADPAIVGRAIRLDGEPHQVVGVMPPGAWFAGTPAQLWTPMAFAAGDTRNTRNSHFVSVVGRLRAGVTLERANADLGAVAARIAERHPENRANSAAATPLRDATLGDIAPTLRLLAGAVVLLLLVACANIANLLLARGAARRRELRVRAALGATRGRLVRQLLTECLLLAAGGGVLGVAVAAVGLRVGASALPGGIPRIHETGLGIDWRALAFALAVATLSAALFGLLPALAGSRVDIGEWLRGGRGSTAGRRPARVRDALVVAEVTLALVLLTGAGLLTRSLIRLQDVDVGVRAERVLTMRVSRPHASREAAARSGAFFDRLVARVEALPGVEAAGVSTNLPLDGGGESKSFWVEGRPPATVEEVPHVWGRQESARSLQALGVPLVKGRWFSDADDADAPRVAIVSAALARRHFPNADPIGQRIALSRPEHMYAPAQLPPGGVFERWTIVGVVGDVKYEGLRAEPEHLVYVPHPQRAARWGWGPSYLVVRTRGDPLAMADAVREQVWALDADQPVADVATMDERMALALRQPRSMTLVVAAFAAVALLLGAVGLYGVIAYAVSEQTREIGVRVALGARPGQVRRMIVRRGLVLAGAGVAMGTVVALGATRLIASLLYGVAPSDPPTIAAVALVVIAVAWLASALPARRAARIDPMVALREQ